MTVRSRILLADDEPELVRALVIRLQASGFACETAGNGREALEQIRRARPDLLIADLLMPEMDGYTLLEHLRADPQQARIPVIVLTAVPPLLKAPRAGILQGAHVIQKPFDSATLITTVRALLTTTIAGG